MNWPPRVGVLATLGLKFHLSPQANAELRAERPNELGTVASDTDPQLASLTGAGRTGKFLQVVPKTSPARPEALGCV